MRWTNEGQKGDDLGQNGAMKDDLNDKQREFARLMVQGMSKADAYRKAFKKNDLSAAAATKAGQRLSKNGAICAYMDSLRVKADAKAVLTREQRMEMLSRSAQECQEAGDMKYMVACLAELNRMDGAYKAVEQKVEVVDGSFGHVMDLVAKGAAQPKI